MSSNIFTGVGTPHITPHTTQNQGGTPHIKLVYMFILGWGHRTEFKDRGRNTAQKDRTDEKVRGDTTHKLNCICIVR